LRDDPPGRRYLHEYGATTEAFGHVAVADRKHAANTQGMCDDQQMMTSCYRESLVRLAEMGLAAILGTA
jgi:hypothetical protein